MKLRDYVYEIYRTSKENNCTDILNMALPMFQADLSAGEQHYCPVPLDFAALKAEYESMTSEERAEDNKDVRQFINQHKAELADAYPDRDKMLSIVREAK